MSEKGKKTKKKTGLGLAIWILTFLIILIVFLVKQEEIKENFEKSGATALIEKKMGKDSSDKKNLQNSKDSEETIIDLTKSLKKNESIAQSESETARSVEKNEAGTIDSLKTMSETKTLQPPDYSDKKSQGSLKQVERTVQSAPVIAERQERISKSNTDDVQAQKDVEKENIRFQISATQTMTEKNTENPVQTAPVPPSNTIKTKICFVAIDSDGPVVRKEVIRTVEKDSPMGDALKMLLAGPSASETKTGCRTLIPEGTRLLSAKIQNGIATLNFNEEFQFNQFGAEGSLAQLMQVVYTATNFSTVKSVQILIEGQKRDYLTEGVWIGSPLTRNSF